MADRVELKPFFEKPQGPSTINWGSQRTYEGVDCEFCGTTWEASEGSPVDWTFVLGRQLVNECCGIFLDRLFEDLGQEFTRKYLHGMAEDPTNVKYSLVLKYTLPEVLESAKNKLAIINMVDLRSKPEEYWKRS